MTKMTYDQKNRIADLSELLENAEFMLRKIGNDPNYAIYMKREIELVCEDARAVLSGSRLHA